jgi:hypothetical protein
VQNDGELTRFTFSDSIPLDNINYIKVSLESSKEIQIEIGTTLEITLKRLEDKINSLEDFPFSILVNESNLSIISNASYPFKVGVDTSKSSMNILDIQRFEKEVVSNIFGNLKSSVSYYAGCRNWEEFRKKVKFVEITNQGWEESKTRITI